MKNLPAKSVQNVPQNTILPGESTKKGADFSKEQLPIHFP